MKKIALLFVLVFLFSLNLFAEDTAASGQNGPAYGATSCEMTGANGEKAPLETLNPGQPMQFGKSENICDVYPDAASCKLGKKN